MNSLPGLITWMLCTLIILPGASGQVNLSSRFTHPEFESNRDNQLLLRLENTNFFKNNEYFGVSAIGYTLLGYSVAPSVMYYAGSRFRFQAGFNAQKSHGAESFTRLEPVFAAHLKLTPRLDLIMGSLRSTVHHQLTEPMYDNEWQYTRPVETGIQFIYKNDIFWADTWLDWQQFIQPGATFPEIFTVGVSTLTRLLKTGSGWGIDLPLQMLAWHSGGQINLDDTPVQSLVNLSFGVNASKIVGGFVNTLGYFGSILVYSDLTEANPLGIYDGNAIYTGFKAEGNKGIAMLAYWRGENFIAPKGSPLFQSVSASNPLEVIPNRRLLTGKLGYNQPFLAQSRLLFLFEAYYDIPNNNLDYAYSLHLSFTPNFKVAKIPFF